MYSPVVLPHFSRQLKRHLKKYPLLKEAIADTLDHFRKEFAVPLGNRLYKVRVASRDIPRGKSKSFRMIILIEEEKALVIPVTLYFKGTQQIMTKRELADHLEIILLELRFMVG